MSTHIIKIMIRPDFILSYWILFWYIAYMFRITRYSPKLLLILGVIENLWIMLVICGYATIETYAYFVVIVIITKLIPLSTIWKVPITAMDVYASIVIIMIYAIWIYMHKSEITKSTIELLKKNKYETPGMYAMKRMTEYVSNLKSSVL